MTTTRQRLTYTFGDAIEKMRTAANLEQNQLADAVGISRSTVSNYERDLSAPPNYRTVQRIAEVCGYDPLDPTLRESWERARARGWINAPPQPELPFEWEQAA